jgi:hypothetical protein
MVQGDYIVANRTMGLDFLAVLMRHSIWIGRRTAQVTRPADFQPRVKGVGAVNEQCAVVTRYGVFTLHDSGVHVFDGNTTTLVSKQINKELLPLDLTNLVNYRMTYNPLTGFVFLFTPVCTWVFDVERRRWSKRSLIAKGGSLYASQIAAKTWAEMVGTWGAQTGTWEDFKAQENTDQAFVFLGLEGGVAKLAKEDRASRTNFGVSMAPVWAFPRVKLPDPRQLVSVRSVVTEYVGGGSLAVELPNEDGDYAAWRDSVLQPSAEPRIKTLYGETTSHGLGARIALGIGTLELSRLTLRFMLAGLRHSEAEYEPLVLLSSGFMFQDDFNRANGSPGDNWVTNAPARFAISGNKLAGNALQANDYIYANVAQNAGAVAQATISGIMLGALLEARFNIAGVSSRSLAAGAFTSTNEFYARVRTNTGITGAASPQAVARPAQASYAIKVEATDASRRIWSDGALLFAAGANWNGAALALNGTSGTGGFGTSHTFVGQALFEDFKLYKSNLITVAGLPAGYKVRVGTKVVVSVGGTTTLDLEELSCPQVKIEILSAADQPLFELIPPAGVWGGDSYQFNP